VEGHCPKCGSPYEIWMDTQRVTTHIADLEVDRPHVFTGAARARVRKVAEERTAQETRQEESRIRSEERMQVREAEQKREEEEKRVKLAEQQAERAASKASEDWDDYDQDDGGRSSNDDRSDSMNPNNDAYGDSRR
jgi:hypothetical protein